MKCSIFDHHTDCGALTGSAVVTAAQMWRLLGAHTMARNHPDMSAPAFTRVVLDSVGGSRVQSTRTIRRTLSSMRRPRSLMDPHKSPEHDYHFLQDLCRKFVELNLGSWSQVMTAVVDDEEWFNGFVYVFQAQVQRIVRSGIKVFTCDAAFIKSEHKVLDGWSLCNLCSRDPNRNLVCLSSCFFVCPRCPPRVPCATWRTWSW